MATKNIRVRFAPSPTGPLHVGGARTALFNYLFAKNPHGAGKGKFILRIEDTDKERSELKWVQEIINELKWLGIEWDEGPDIDGASGPYKQSQRMEIYEKYLKQLLQEDKAYYCFCAQEELEDKRQEQMARGVAPKYDGKCSHLSSELVKKNLAEGKPAVIRFRIANKKVKFKDLVRGEIEFDAGLLGDVVIAKDLNAPLYHFTVVVDDYLMQISHVIRGEEHLSNTPRQILIYRALGFEHPEYAHLPLLLNPDRSKLSKRHGDVALADYHKQGYLPEAIINFMALLGWNPGTEREVFTLSQLVKEFSIEKAQKGGAVFNIKRLDFLNSLYIREKAPEKLVLLCAPYLKAAGLLVKGQISDDKLQKIVEVSKQRMKKLSEIVELTDFFFKDKLNYEKNLLKWDKMKDEDIKGALLLCDKILSNIKIWDAKKVEEVLFEGAAEFNKQKGFPEKNRGFLLWPLRVALSGKEFSPSPFEIADILGKENTLARIAEAIKKL
ncbi:MAG: glutamate--tRNA ligase [Candidatus Staskawiczbacteria bacterium RIFOXYC1_FULL_37_43]|nr:MAG: glutamate--tRNA ligase [Candidatus Staskawiczbacteria bacterium RIFCSPHIGHO2_01_FULL_37_17]OGZ71237.1 MAG: glutamate--tRNA ligase [Candidatus Staskawiczbacteria bacterium RIFCSPLOWO2_01_FULL_37_19]OGZ75623.1 MAG: glutamate--tRNA ligase [Candidatus Staskawiczbacteria bacterium RIFOXYA1_FULL_37_15]OGZ76647.1 MAG: glutamate--tRNA ligase [Candidatus Staskawiczbacteria bacterium RIFOXYA12_FULL_37_10]OGZ79899.1 MAG: glutamate--tRNA ligase [Candidatus Staskawiczbacteria bacterium RIFOXYB1_FULL